MINHLTGLFYGWRMVAASAAVRVLGAGLHSYGFTVFFLPLSQELNLSRTATSFAFSLSRAEGAIEGPIVGHLLDRYGPRPIMIAAVVTHGDRLLVALADRKLRRLSSDLHRIDFAYSRRRLHARADDVDKHLVYPPARPRHDHQQRRLRRRRHADRARAQPGRALLGLALGRRRRRYHVYRVRFAALFDDPAITGKHGTAARRRQRRRYENDRRRRSSDRERNQRERRAKRSALWPFGRSFLAPPCATPPIMRSRLTSCR